MLSPHTLKQDLAIPWSCIRWSLYFKRGANQKEWVMMMSWGKETCQKQTWVWPVCFSNDAASQANSSECVVGHWVPWLLLMCFCFGGGGCNCIVLSRLASLFGCTEQLHCTAAPLLFLTLPIVSLHLLLSYLPCICPSHLSLSLFTSFFHF